jgi:hypothetical protein
LKFVGAGPTNGTSAPASVSGPASKQLALIADQMPSALHPVTNALTAALLGSLIVLPAATIRAK